MFVVCFPSSNSPGASTILFRSSPTSYKSNYFEPVPRMVKIKIIRSTDEHFINSKNVFTLNAPSYSAVVKALRCKYIGCEYDSVICFSLFVGRFPWMSSFSHLSLASPMSWLIKPFAEMLFNIHFRNNYLQNFQEMASGKL